MLTGIVEGPGEIVAVTDIDGGRRLRIRTDLAFDDLHHSQSIAVSGACLTVEAFGGDWSEVFLAAETIEKTYLGDAVEDGRVNFEHALAVGDRFDGRIVQGRADGTMTVTDVERVGDDWFFEFDLPEPLANYVVQKGSVCPDGISLTVADRREGTSAMAIIPATYDPTTLPEKAVGDPIHVEVDVVVKYVESMLDGYAEWLVVEQGGRFLRFVRSRTVAVSLQSSNSVHSELNDAAFGPDA